MSEKTADLLTVNDACSHCGRKAGEGGCDWIECPGHSPRTTEREMNITRALTEALARMHLGDSVAARLMATAPQLLAALRAVVSVADRKTAEFDLAHAAIAEAEGETPGPWAIFHTGNINMIVPAMRDGMIADLIDNAANARLIAAAPDLLDALLAVQKADREGKIDLPHQWIADVIDAAISKAEGKTS